MTQLINTRIFSKYDKQPENIYRDFCKDKGIDLHYFEQASRAFLDAFDRVIEHDLMNYFYLGSFYGSMSRYFSALSVPDQWNHTSNFNRAKKLLSTRHPNAPTREYKPTVNTYKKHLQPVS